MTAPRANEPAHHAALEGRAHANTPRALLAQLATAVRFLAILPVGGQVVPIGESALFFPLVGLGLGGCLAAIDLALAPVTPDGVRSVVLVAALATLTGGRHLNGLAATAAGWTTRDRERSLAIMRDRATGALGVAALVVVLLLKVRSLDALAGETRLAALLLAPMLARWTLVVLAFGSRPARPDGVGHAIVTSIKFREFGFASVVALGVTLASQAARGLAAVVVLALVTIACRVAAHRKLGGITGHLLGAIGELSEALVLVVFALGVAPRAAVV